jgi:hypothetical protein
MSTPARSAPSATSTWASPKRNCAASPRRPGSAVQVCQVVTQEKRPPHFEVLALQARKE